MYVWSKFVNGMYLYRREKPLVENLLIVHLNVSEYVYSCRYSIISYSLL